MTPLLGTIPIQVVDLLVRGGAPLISGNRLDQLVEIYVRDEQSFDDVATSVSFQSQIASEPARPRMLVSIGP